MFYKMIKIAQICSRYDGRGLIFYRFYSLAKHGVVES